mmetsp:Transcript_21826/g.66913  ORF Transcript_21826/g.66913 Transcript_21826/m.66913 type:complete len:221 (+) Transcript_21826:1460-2122(+)
MRRRRRRARHRYGPHRTLQPEPPIPLPLHGHWPAQVHDGRGLGEAHEHGHAREPLRGQGRAVHGGRVRHGLLRWPRRRVHGARQHRCAALHGQPLPLLRPADVRERHHGHQGQHADRRAAFDGALRRHARPAREERARVHAQELSAPNRAHHPVGARLVRGRLQADARLGQRVPLRRRVPEEARTPAEHPPRDADGGDAQPRGGPPAQLRRLRRVGKAAV